MFERPLKLRRERAKPRPSERNQRIYMEVRVHGRLQAEVAQRYGMTPGRISAICQQVERWRLSLDKQPLDQAHTMQEWRLELLRIREGYEKACLMAVHSHLLQQRGVITVHTSNRSGKTVTKRTVRKVRPSAQWLKMAEKCIRGIEGINNRLGPSAPPCRIGEKLDAMLSEFLATQVAEGNEQSSAESPTTTSEMVQGSRGEMGPSV